MWRKKNVIHVLKDGRNTKAPLTSLIFFIKAAAFEILIYCISLWREDTSCCLTHPSSSSIHPNMYTHMHGPKKKEKNVAAAAETGNEGSRIAQ